MATYILKRSPREKKTAEKKPTKSPVFRRFSSNSLVFRQTDDLGCSVTQSILNFF